MLTLAGILFLLSVLIVCFLGFILALKILVYLFIAYGIYKIIEWIFN